MNIFTKKKFCIVATSGISLLNFRGNLINTIADAGNCVTCISIEDCKSMDAIMDSLNATYLQVKGDRTSIGIIGGIRMILGYVSAFRKVRPDIIYLYMSKPIAFGAIAARLSRIEHINILVNGLENAFYRTTVKDFFIRAVMSKLYKIACRNADNVFFQNQDDLNFFVKNKILTRDNACIVNGSGVDMQHFYLAPLPKAPVVLMAARLLWSKGIREFLEAVTTVKKSLPSLKVLLVGGLDNNDEALTKEDLETYIKKYDIEYCGYSRDIRRQIEKASIFVLPSYHEGLPRVVLEAMAMGRPIITTDAPGCKETVVDGLNGFLVPVRNSLMLSDKLLTLAKDEQLRESMGQASRRLCEKKFEISKINHFIINKITKSL